MKFKKDIYIIKWNDSYTHDKWVDLEYAIKEFRKPIEIITTGYIIYRNKKCVVLVQSYDGSNVDGVFHIPMSTIVSIKKQ